jgi:hypothetical protein
MGLDVIPTHYTTEYNTNWISRTQQVKQRLADYVDVIQFNGERKRFDRVQPSVSRRRTERNAPTPVSAATSDSRWAYRQFFDIPARLLDPSDAMNLGTVTLPTSQYIEDDAKAYNRDKDDLACSIALDAVKTGELGTTQTVLPAAQQIVNGSTGLTLAKLITANEIRLAAEMEDDTPWVLVVSSKQVSDLLNDPKLISSDYNTVKALVAGQVDSFMGFKFVLNRRLPKVGTTRTCVAWAKGAIKLIAGGMRSDISVRKDLSMATQVYSQYELGGTRVHDEAVIQIDCTET